MSVLVFYTNFPEIFLLLRKIQLDILKNVQTSLCKVPIILDRF